MRARRFGVFAGLAVLALVGLDAWYELGTARIITIEVTDKERIVEGSGEGVSSKYLVFTKNYDVLENTDSWWYLKFDSSSIYGRIEPGKSYTVKVYGWRIGFFSMYPNIVNIVG